jgi:Peptidase M50B-like
MPESDADQLGHITHVPALFWVTLFFLVNIAVLVIGGLMLAGHWLTVSAPWN